MFEKISNWTELLFPSKLLRQDSVIACMVNEIPESDWTDQVQIIGWLYQYYNEERKNEVINILKSTIKKEDIPAATQLFTTDWVVRYIVDNSLGRYWIERNPKSSLINELEYFTTPKDGDIKNIDEHISPDQIKVFDPCMGSAHFLAYAFDVLMKIYTECGYSEREAAKSIVENNLYGLDIDDRASQLAYFAVMMKARNYNRRILKGDVAANVFSIQESNDFNRDYLSLFGEMRQTAEKLIDEFIDAKEYGSILNLKITEQEIDSLQSALDEINETDYDNIFDSIRKSGVVTSFQPLLKQAKVMVQKYQIVVTNPPYMNKFESNLKKFINNNYKDYSGDLFSVFMYRNFLYCTKGGYTGFMTPFVWMFIKTYEKLRDYIIHNKTITTLIQMEYSAFEEATVPICSFVFKNEADGENGLYFRLSDFKGGMEVQRQKVVEALANKDCGYFYSAKQSNFSKIPGSPVAYWVSEAFVKAFEDGKRIGEIADAKQGLATADNNRFVRLWYEINNNRTCFNAKDNNEAYQSNKKWFPYNKGGEFRKWYGNNDYIVNWENDGKEIKNFKNSVVRNPNYYFNQCFSWSLISSSVAAFRYKPIGHIFDVAGMSCFSKNNLYYLLALCNTKVVMEFLFVLAPTINYQCGDIANIPVKFDDNKKDYIEAKTVENIDISKSDWDFYETSWDFKRNPLV